jgi:CHAT domain-containing protein
VRDIAALPRMYRRLAYLSACMTALSDGLLVDEGMHVASAFQLAGFRAVIGTLWRIDDSAAEEIAKSFYTSQKAGQSVAMSLHDAVRALRERYPGNRRCGLPSCTSVSSQRRLDLREPTFSVIEGRVQVSRAIDFVRGCTSTWQLLLLMLRSLDC